MYLYHPNHRIVLRLQYAWNTQETMNAMTQTILIENDAKAMVEAHLDRLGQAPELRMTDAQKQELFDEIAIELKQRGPVCAGARLKTESQKFRN